MKILKNLFILICSATLMMSCSTTKNSVNTDSGNFVVTSELTNIDYPLADTVYKYSVKGALTGYELSEDMMRVADEMKANKPLNADITQLGQGVIVSFAGNDEMFRFGEFKLTKKAKTNLRYLAFNLKENPNLYVAAFGRADAIGSVDFNEDLGYKRAAMVANYLKICGIQQDRLFVDSFGEKYPEMMGDSELTMFDKRRVDMLVIPSNEMRKYSGM
jgi:outer membrane protein OmpA-like peptidoglycan-associated protein